MLHANGLQGPKTVHRQERRMTVQGKTVLVTGGTSGIGEAIARAYAAEGADVVITGRSEERGRQITDSLTKEGRSARFIRADLEDFDDVKRLTRDVEHVPGCGDDSVVVPCGSVHGVGCVVFGWRYFLIVKDRLFVSRAFL